MTKIVIGNYSHIGDSDSKSYKNTKQTCKHEVQFFFLIKKINIFYTRLYIYIATSNNTKYKHAVTSSLVTALWGQTRG